MEMPEVERHTNRHLPLLVHKGPSQWFLWQPESANEIAVTAVLNFKPPSQTGRGKPVVDTQVTQSGFHGRPRVGCPLWL